MKKYFALAFTFFAFCYSTLALAYVPTRLLDFTKTVNANGKVVFIRDKEFGASKAKEGQMIWENGVGLVDGGARFKTNTPLPIGSGLAKVQTSGVVKGAQIVTALLPFVVPGAGGLAIGILGPPLIDWLADGGVRPAQGPNAPGSPGNPSRLPFERPSESPYSCESGLCYTFETFGHTAATRSAACSAGVAAWAAANVGKSGTNIAGPVTATVSGDSCTVHAVNSYDGTPISTTDGIRKKAVSETGSTWQPASIEDIRKQMESIPAGAPLMDFLLEKGANFVGETTSISGPDSVSQGESKFNTVILPLPSTTETEIFSGKPTHISDGKIGNGYRDVRVDGVPQFTGGSMSAQLQPTVVSIPTTTNTSVSYNPATNQTTVTTTKSYPGASVEQIAKSDTALQYSTPGGSAMVSGTTKTEVTTTVKDAQGNVISQTTAQQNSAPLPDKTSESQPDVSFSDSALPGVPKLYERKYPDGITGVWDQKIAGIKATPLFSLGRNIMPTFATSGSCPTFTVPLDLATWSNYGSGDFSPPCWVWDFGKVVIVASSLLLARRLIFGG